MKAKGFLAMLALSLVLVILGVTTVFGVDNTAGQIVGAVLVFVGAFALVGSARVRARHVREMERRRDAGELV